MPDSVSALGEASDHQRRRRDRFPGRRPAAVAMTWTSLRNPSKFSSAGSAYRRSNNLLLRPHSGRPSYQQKKPPGDPAGGERLFPGNSPSAGRNPGQGGHLLLPTVVQNDGIAMADEAAPIAQWRRSSRFPDSYAWSRFRPGVSSDIHASFGCCRYRRSLTPSAKSVLLVPTGREATSRGHGGCAGREAMLGAATDHVALETPSRVPTPASVQISGLSILPRHL